MSSNLRKDIATSLSGRIQSQGLRVVREQELGDDAEVVLEGDDLRIRIVRDRGQIFVDFGSAKEPEVWLDSFFLLQLLQLRESPFLHGGTSVVHLPALGKFLQHHLGDILDLLRQDTIGETERKVAELKTVSAKLRFGRN